MELSPGRTGILVGQLRTERLQVVLTHAAPIHPEPDSFVADELHGADGFVNRRLLGMVGSEFVFQNQHECLASWPLHESRFRA
jgi:hypothetical protein